MPTGHTHTRHLPSLMQNALVLYIILLSVAAVLRDISEGTSYQTVRLVFRPYAHVPPSSCTSERLRPSSAISDTFRPHRHSSLSFGSHPYMSSLSNPHACMISLVRVSRRAKILSLHIHTFILHLALFTLRSLYFFAIGHAPVFSLGSSLPPIQTALPNSPTHTCRCGVYGEFPLSAVSSQDPRRRSRNTTCTRAVTIRAPLLSLAATQKIRVGFFSSLY